MTGTAMRRWCRAMVPLAAVAVVADLAWVHASFIGHYPLVAGDVTRLAWDAVYAGLLALGASAAGVTEPPRRLVEAVSASVAAVVGAAGMISLVQLASGSTVLPRFVVFGSAAVLAPAYVGAARLGDRLRRQHESLDRVVAVCSPEEAAALEHDLARAAERPARLVGSLAPALARPDGTDRPLVALARQRGATVVVLDRAAQGDEAVVAQAATLHRQGVRVRTLALFYDQWLGKLPIGELEQVSLMFDIQELHVRQYARLKRMADVAVAALGCLVLVVAVPVVALADLLGNRGPLLYRQQRVGRGGQPFTMLKFRTMAEGAPAEEIAGGRRPPQPASDESLTPEPSPTFGRSPTPEPSPWTSLDDPRLGWVGRWMRRTHVDELPQMLNVLRGELSLVGPRPEQPGYVEELRRQIPFYDVRHLVHPGLTGWAQVKFPYGASVSDALEKLQYEVYYLRHQGLVLDARIMARTLRSVVAGHGR